MTEHEWLECAEPKEMLKCLDIMVSDRKLRLFAVSCCRRAWHLLTSEGSREAVQVSEDYADGFVGEKRLKATYRKAPRFNSQDATDANAAYPAYAANAAALVASSFHPRYSFGDLSGPAGTALGIADDACYALTWYDVANSGESDVDTPTFFKHPVLQHETRLQCDLLRDIFDNPFRPVTINPAWLTWNDGTVQKVAQAIYDERAFDRMPILADALEEAGCENAAILTHCRQQGEHVRGCWVVDLLLGKE